VSPFKAWVWRHRFRIVVYAMMLLAATLVLLDWPHLGLLYVATAATIHYGLDNPRRRQRSEW
jgi:hypothetical protein